LGLIQHKIVLNMACIHTVHAVYIHTHTYTYYRTAKHHPEQTMACKHQMLLFRLKTTTTAEHSLSHLTCSVAKDLCVRETGKGKIRAPTTMLIRVPHTSHDESSTCGLL